MRALAVIDCSAGIEVRGLDPGTDADQRGLGSKIHGRFAVLEDELDLPGRVLSFDEHAAGYYAEIVAVRDRIGRPIGVADAQTAAICRLPGATLATPTITGCAETGLVLVGPWDLS